MDNARGRGRPKLTWVEIIKKDLVLCDLTNIITLDSVESNIDKIRNERIHKMIEVTSIEEKMRENWLRWFGHIKRRTINTPIRKSDAIHIEANARGRGRPKLTWVEIIKKNLVLYGLTDIMAVDRV